MVCLLMKWIVVMHNFLYTFLFVLHRKAGVSAYLYNEITVSKGLNLVFDIVITMSNSCDIILYSIVYKNLVHIVIINVR